MFPVVDCWLPVVGIALVSVGLSISYLPLLTLPLGVSNLSTVPADSSVFVNWLDHQCSGKDSLLLPAHLRHMCINIALRSSKVGWGCFMILLMKIIP